MSQHLSEADKDLLLKLAERCGQLARINDRLAILAIGFFLRRMIDASCEVLQINERETD
jgi:hypothetical protein